MTLGQALMLLVSREVLASKGKALYPRFKADISGWQVPSELGRTIGKLETDYNVRVSFTKLPVADPWEAAAEKLLGKKYPKKGMSSYLAYYLMGLWVLDQIEKARTDAEEKFALIDAKTKAIEEFLNSQAHWFSCTVEELPEVMGKLAFMPRERVEFVSDSIKDMRDVKVMTAGLHKQLEDAMAESYQSLGQVALLEEMVLWPKHLSWRNVLYYLLLKLTNFATTADFAAVRADAQAFLKSENGARKVALFSQNKK